MSITPQKLQQITKENMEERLGRMLKVIGFSVSSQLQQYQSYLADYPPGSLGRDQLLAAIKSRKKAVYPAVCFLRLKRALEQQKEKQNQNLFSWLYRKLRGSRKQDEKSAKTSKELQHKPKEQAVISQKKKLNLQMRDEISSEHKQNKALVAAFQQQSNPLLERYMAASEGQKNLSQTQGQKNAN